VSTPMSVIGRPAPGFTLVEVLGIIVLLGLACTLVYPNLVDSAEKTHVQYIGKLLISDLQQAQETAVSERDSIGVVLADDGYYYNLGDREIERSFPEYDFSFKVIITTDDGETAALLDEETVLTFKPDGSCDEQTVNWQSKHFCGTLLVDADGTASWNYETKKKK
jgi:type II secretory pathway pseudopilin PulG